MVKILFCASHPSQPIGYSRIANILSNYLADNESIDLYYFAFSNYPATSIKTRVIHPKINIIDVLNEEGLVEGKENYGTTLIEKYMKLIKPDVLFIYNDIIVSCRLFNALLEYKKQIKSGLVHHNYKTILYLDLVYKYQRLEQLEYIYSQTDLIYVFSDCWKKHLVDLGFPKSKVRLLYHGIQKDIFTPVDKQLARESLKLSPADFIILNTNRNNYRKQIDVTVKAFLLLLKKHNLSSNLKLMLNCGIVSKSGYDLIHLIKVECVKLGLPIDTVLNNHILQLPNSGNLDDRVLNLLYNAVDLGINTCGGEGFGLCNAEGAYLGIPQVVSNVGGLSDIFKSFDDMLVNPVTSVYVNNLLDGHNGDFDVFKPEDFCEKMDIYYTNEDKRKEDGEKLKKMVEMKYDWNYILLMFVSGLEEYLKE